MPQEEMYAVIMAGGKGTRFWPLSRERRPKHLLDILGEQTIIQQTVARLVPLLPPARILVVTAASHAEELSRQLPQLPAANIIVEPAGRNTAACIGLAALHLRRRGGTNAVMAVLPADHLIGDEERFRSLLVAAGAMAARGEHLVTIGIEPRIPETGYGYLELGPSQAKVAGITFYAVASVREKPDAATAAQFLHHGGFLWNSGMFFWTVEAIMRAFSRWLPELYNALQQMEAALGTAAEAQAIARVYSSLQPISIDYGVMEKADNALVAWGDFGWSDVGSWDALWEVLPKDTHGNAAQGSVRFVGIDTRRSLLYGRQKLIAVVGLEDVIVVETDDALLICRREASQDVRKVVDELVARGETELL